MPLKLACWNEEVNSIFRMMRKTKPNCVFPFWMGTLIVSHCDLILFLIIELNDCWGGTSGVILLSHLRPFKQVILVHVSDVGVVCIHLWLAGFSLNVAHQALSYSICCIHLAPPPLPPPPKIVCIHFPRERVCWFAEINCYLCHGQYEEEDINDSEAK